VQLMAAEPKVGQRWEVLAAQGGVARAFRLPGEEEEESVTGAGIILSVFPVVSKKGSLEPRTRLK